MQRVLYQLDDGGLVGVRVSPDKILFPVATGSAVEKSARGKASGSRRSSTGIQCRGLVARTSDTPQELFLPVFRPQDWQGFVLGHQVSYEGKQWTVYKKVPERLI